MKKTFPPLSLFISILCGLEIVTLLFWCLFHSRVGHFPEPVSIWEIPRIPLPRYFDFLFNVVWAVVFTIIKSSKEYAVVKRKKRSVLYKSIVYEVKSSIFITACIILYFFVDHRQGGEFRELCSTYIPLVILVVGALVHTSANPAKVALYCILMSVPLNTLLGAIYAAPLFIISEIYMYVRIRKYAWKFMRRKGKIIQFHLSSG